MEVAYTKNLVYSNGDRKISYVCFESTNSESLEAFVKSFNEDRLSITLGESIHRIFVFGRVVENEWDEKFNSIKDLLCAGGKDLMYKYVNGKFTKEVIGD